MKPALFLPVFLLLAGCSQSEPVVVSAPPVVIERPLLKDKIRTGQFKCSSRPKAKLTDDMTNRQAAIFITKIDWNNKDCARKNDALLKMITEEK